MIKPLSVTGEGDNISYARQWSPDKDGINRRETMYRCPNKSFEQLNLLTVMHKIRHISMLTMAKYIEIDGRNFFI